MKFGKYLAESLIQEWKTQFIDYGRLKKCIKALDRADIGQTSVEFLFHIDRELEKVESFYCSCLSTLKRLVEKADLATAENRVTENILLDEYVKRRAMIKAVKIIDDCEVYIRKLSKYCFLNLEGFRKILKKFEKNGGDSKSYSEKVLSSQFASYRKCLTDLDENLKQFLKRVDQKSGESITKKELDKIWDKASNLVLERDILEDDLCDKIIEHARSLGFDAHYFDHSRSFNDFSILSVEKEIFLLCLLGEICSWSAIKCLEGLLSLLQVDLEKLERISDCNLLVEFVSFQNKSEKKLNHRDKTFLEYLLSRGRMDADTMPNLLHIAAGLHADIFRPIFTRVMVLSPLLVDQIDEYFVTPLYYAIVSNRGDNCRLIIDQCVRSNIPVKVYEAEKKFNPAILCVDVNCQESLKAIIEFEPQLIDDVDDNGQTPLHHCAKRNLIECAKILLERGADIDLTDTSSKWTALFFAAVIGSEEFCQLLVQYNAKLESKDNEGWQACEHAAFRGHHTVAKMIKPEVSIYEMPMQNAADQITPISSISVGHAFLGEGIRVYFRIDTHNSTFWNKFVIEDKFYSGEKHLDMRISGSHPSIGEKYFDIGPQSNDTEVFFEVTHNLAKDCSSHYFLFTIEEDSNLANGAIPFATLFGEKRNNASFDLNLPLIDGRGQVTCILNIGILVATSFRPSLGQDLDLTKIYWRSLNNKIIGHRGCGANSNIPKLQIGENTVLSFVTAASLGAEYVEFGIVLSTLCTNFLDVQLTKDKVPVLYHDFIVKEKGYNTPVGNLYFKQFRDLHNNPPSWPKFSGDDYFVQRRRSLIDLKDERQDKKLSELYIKSPFSTLKDALVSVPKEVGFNIELKYPSEDEIEDLEISSVVNMNTFCDAILHDVYKFGSDRNILFSSFHPDICKLVSIKQPNYPVFFLTEAGISRSSDERTNSLQAAVKFATENHLMGIVCESSALVEFPKLIHTVRRNGLLLFTYGNENNQVHAAKRQISNGVDAIIVDSVARIRHGIVAE